MTIWKEREDSQEFRKELLVSKQDARVVQAEDLANRLVALWYHVCDFLVAVLIRPIPWLS